MEQHEARTNSVHSQFLMNSSKKNNNKAKQNSEGIWPIYYPNFPSTKEYATQQCVPLTLKNNITIMPFSYTLHQVMYASNEVRMLIINFASKMVKHGTKHDYYAIFVVRCKFKVA